MKTSGQLLYRQGYKYRLERDWGCQTTILDWPYTIASLDGGKPWVQLGVTGYLKFRAGYCYDGPSGPTIDTPPAMGPAAGHDGLYQGARLGHLPQEDSFRKRVDDWFYQFLLDEGISRLRAWTWYRGIRAGAGYAWKAKLEEVHEAPSGRIYRVQPGSKEALELIL